MTAKKGKKGSSSKIGPKARLVTRSKLAVMPTRRILVPEPQTEVITEKTYVTTEPEVEIRKPATLSQALTEPGVAVVKPKTRVRKVRSSTRKTA